MNVIGELGDLIIRYQRGIEIAILIILAGILVLWLVRNYGKHKVKKDLLDDIGEKVSDINDTVHSIDKYQKIVVRNLGMSDMPLSGESHGVTAGKGPGDSTGAAKNEEDAAAKSEETVATKNEETAATEEDGAEEGAAAEKDIQTISLVPPKDKLSSIINDGAMKEQRDEIPEDAVPVSDDRELMYEEEPVTMKEEEEDAVDYSGKSIFEIYEMMRSQERRVITPAARTEAATGEPPAEPEPNKPRKARTSPSRKYNERDCAVDKHGNVYTAEMLAQQIN